MKSNKSYSEAALAFTLPPPIYGSHITIVPERASKQIKLVAAITGVPEGITIQSLEGGIFLVPLPQALWLQE